MNYRICITPEAEFSGRGTLSGRCGRLVLLYGGRVNCGGLVGLISLSCARKCCCGPEVSHSVLRGCRRKLVYLSTYLTNRVPRGLLTESCRKTGTTTL